MPPCRPLTHPYTPLSLVQFFLVSRLLRCFTHDTDPRSPPNPHTLPWACTQPHQPRPDLALFIEGEEEGNEDVPQENRDICAALTDDAVVRLLVNAACDENVLPSGRDEGRVTKRVAAEARTLIAWM